MSNPNSAGHDFDLGDNSAILQINSPKDNVSGPYVVVHKDTDDRWAIVALDWDEDPRLGIRWFWDGNGNPQSRGFPTWYVVPAKLAGAILGAIPLDSEFSVRINEFLAGKLPGEKLRK